MNTKKFAKMALMHNFDCINVSSETLISRSRLGTVVLMPSSMQSLEIPS